MDLQEGIVEEEKRKKNFLTDNVFGELGKFSLAFIKSSYNSSNNHILFMFNIIIVFKRRPAQKEKNMKPAIPKEEEKKIMKAVEYRNLIKEVKEDFIHQNKMSLGF